MQKLSGLLDSAKSALEKEWGSPAPILLKEDALPLSQIPATPSASVYIATRTLKTIHGNSADLLRPRGRSRTTTRSTASPLPRQKLIGNREFSFYLEYITEKSPSRKPGS